MTNSIILSHHHGLLLIRRCKYYIFYLIMKISDYVMVLSFRTDTSGKQSRPRSDCNFLLARETEICPLCLNFRLITANFSDVQELGTLQFSCYFVDVYILCL